MIDHEQKQLRLIDWGLAEFYHPGKEYAAMPLAVQNFVSLAFAHVLSFCTFYISTGIRTDPMCLQAVIVPYEHTC